MREVIRPLAAWDAVRRLQVTLPPGSILHECVIRRSLDSAGGETAEPYSMEFESQGQRYSCALSAFQPRTRSVAVVAEGPGAVLPAASV